MDEVRRLDSLRLAVLDTHLRRRTRSDVRDVYRAMSVVGRKPMQLTQRIAPCLWFDDQAEQAAAFYVSVFKNSRIVSVTRYTEAGREIAQAARRAR